MVHHFQVSKQRRLLQVTCAIIWCFLGAGTIFGFAAFKPVLVSEGVYSQYCTPEEIEDNVPICSQQELKLNFMFTLGAVMTNGVSIFVGLILDRWGPRACGFIGAFFLAAGSLTLRSALSIEIFDAFLVGYSLLALGGPFTSISAFQLSNAFPAYSGTVLALITGAFDASSALFLLYRIAYTKSEGAFTISKFFTWYLITPVFLVLVQTFVMHKESYKTVKEIIESAEEDIATFGSRRLSIKINSSVADVDERAGLLANADNSQNYTDAIDDNDEDAEETAIEASKKAALADATKISGVWGALHGKPASEQVKSWWFIIMVFYTTIQMVRINYFVATVYSQYSFLFGSYERAKELNQFFDLALPLGGIIGIPFVGLLLDNLSTFAVLLILSVVSVAIGIFGIFPFYITALCNVCLLVVYRPFYYTCVSDYCAKVFGFDTFGTTYGLIIAFSGMMNLLQSPLDRLTHEVFNYDPRPVNIGLIAFTVILASTLLLYINSQLKHMKRKQLENEAEGAHTEIMPGVNV